MSRSYKKHPFYRMSLWGRNSMKKGKQYANRKIRRKLKNPNINVGNGNHYKSLGIDSWDLWEFCFYETKQDAINKHKRWQTELFYGIQTWMSHYDWTLKDTIDDWERWYKRK